MAARDWRAVGERVAIERARHWTRTGFARATGLSLRVLEDLEKGMARDYKPDTLAAVEVALQWEPGTCYRIADGLAPRYEGGRELRAILDAWPHLTDEVRQVLADVAERFARE